METLAKQIEGRMHGTWNHCIIRDEELQRIWPIQEEDREEKIAQFATKYGFRLRFYKKGLCAIFDKWPPQRGGLTLHRFLIGELMNMDARDDSQVDQARSLETLARHIEWHLKERPFYIVFEDEIDRYWPTEKLTDTERERQIQAFAESHGWNAFIHNTDPDRTRAIFLRE